MKASITIYHNPRCSKSRQTLALLETNGITPKVVHYLDTPPSAEELTTLLAKLGLQARELLRTGEEAYKHLKLKDPSLNEAELIDAMVNNPKLIERPIVVKGKRAIIGRPPERVLSLL